MNQSKGNSAFLSIATICLRTPKNKKTPHIALIRKNVLSFFWGGGGLLEQLEDWGFPHGLASQLNHTTADSAALRPKAPKP